MTETYKKTSFAFFIFLIIIYVTLIILFAIYINKLDNKGQNIVILHNKIRANHNADPLIGNDNLAIAAQNGASKCIFNDDQNDSFNNNGTINYAGENLATMSSENECAYSKPGSNECTQTYNYKPMAAFLGNTECPCYLQYKDQINEQGNWNGIPCQVGHFTQEIGQSTKEIGCGSKICNSTNDPEKNVYNVSCFYYPPGNVVESNGKIDFNSNVDANSCNLLV